jgi:glycosyltransferase involved in cell wall biosynthesis
MKQGERFALDLAAYARSFDLLDLSVRPDLAKTCDGIRVMNLRAVPPAIRARATHGVPYVLTLGYDHSGLALIAGKRGKALAWRVLRSVACRWASGIICSSHGLADRWALARRYPEVPQCVIPNGVPLDRFWIPAVHSGATVHVVAVGRLAPEKNLSTLLFALGRIKDTTPPTTVTFYGEGPERAMLAGLAKELGVHLSLPGQVPYSKIPEALRAANLFCMPSFSEGSPKALFEALATGLPCVVSSGFADVSRYPVWRHDPGNVGSLVSELELALASIGVGWNGKAGRAHMERDHHLAKNLAAEVSFTRRVLQREQDVHDEEE